MSIETDLQQFTGTDHYYLLQPGFVLTDGAKYLADNTHCYWLMDIIVSLKFVDECRGEDWWTVKLSLTPNEPQAAAVVVEDGNSNVLYRQRIPFTDFPLPEIVLWAVKQDHLRVILLPNEY